MKFLFAILILSMATSSFAMSAKKVFNIDFAEDNISSHSERVDFALLEKKYPLSNSARKEITTNHLESLSGDQLDQLFARIDSGAIPEGYFEKKVLTPSDTGVSALVRKMGAFTGWAAEKAIQFLVDGTRGMVFEPSKKEAFSTGKPLYMFLITDRGERSQLENYRYNELSINNYYKVFPAKTYCNIGALDTRKESYIVDYTFSDDLKSYHEKPDHLLTRKGLKMKTEFRSVNDHVLLGRVYMDNIFMYYIALEKYKYVKRDPSSHLKGNIKKTRDFAVRKIEKPACGV